MLALTPGTRKLIGRAELAAMERDAWLVNVARGAVVDTEALVDALRSGQIGGAALDVTDPEPLPDGHPLWDLPNCLITPHTADTEGGGGGVKNKCAGRLLVRAASPEYVRRARPPGRTGRPGWTPTSALLTRLATAGRIQAAD
jgi:hypothetical protein